MVLKCIKVPTRQVTSTSHKFSLKRCVVIDRRYRRKNGDGNVYACLVSTRWRHMIMQCRQDGDLAN